MAEEIVGSHFEAKNGLGQNGYQGASSTRGKASSGFLPDAPPAVVSNRSRVIDASPIAPAHGQRGATPGGKVPANGRPVTTRG